MLADPSIVAAELARRHRDTDTGTGSRSDLALIEAALDRLGTQERRLVKLFRFGEISEAIIAAASAELKRERERLERERATLTARLKEAERAVCDFEGVAVYFERVRQRLGALGYADRRLALEALGMTVTVDADECRVEGVIPVDSEDIAPQAS